MKTRRNVELTFTAPAKPKKEDNTPYDGGFHIQAPKKRKKACGASKRSSVQSFTFR